MSKKEFIKSVSDSRDIFKVTNAVSKLIHPNSYCRIDNEREWFLKLLKMWDTGGDYGTCYEENYIQYHKLCKEYGENNVWFIRSVFDANLNDKDCHHTFCIVFYDNMYFYHDIANNEEKHLDIVWWFEEVVGYKNIKYWNVKSPKKNGRNAIPNHRAEKVIKKMFIHNKNVNADKYKLINLLKAKAKSN